MNINLKFAIWCARKCLHMWEPPENVIMWLDDPENPKKAKSARMTTAATVEDTRRISREAAHVAWKAAYLATTETPMELMVTSKSIAAATARLLNTNADAIKHEFVSTWTDKELETIDPEWVDYINVEIFSR